MIAVYPGSFDPITNGHYDIIKRTLKLVDFLIVAVLNNSRKNNLFDVDDRISMIKSSLGNLKNVEVKSFSGLLVDFCKEQNSDTIIRGLRAVTDFEYEFQLALTNKMLNKNIETIFLAASSKYLYLSSSIVKEVASYDGDISDMVPAEVLKTITKKFRRAL